MVQLRARRSDGQAMRNMIAHGEMIGVAVLVIIGVVLIVLAPTKPQTEPVLTR